MIEKHRKSHALQEFLSFLRDALSSWHSETLTQLFDIDAMTELLRFLLDPSTPPDEEEAASPGGRLGILWGWRNRRNRWENGEIWGHHQKPSRFCGKHVIYWWNIGGFVGICPWEGTVSLWCSRNSSVRCHSYCSLLQIHTAIANHPFF